MGEQKRYGAQVAPSQRKSVKHFVYLMEAPRDRVKIGRTNNPATRLRGVQVGAHEPISLAHTWKLDRPAALKLERDLQRLFKWACTKGEWHHCEAADIRSVGDMMVAGNEDAAKQVADLLRQCAVAYAATDQAVKRSDSAEVGRLCDIAWDLRGAALRLGLQPTDVDLCSMDLREQAA